MSPATPFDDKIHACAKCKLRKTCRLPVPGDGNFQAPVLFVGEAPGAQEDVANKPFVGRSGKLLTGILEKLGMVRDRDYYISNIVKCRPPENRDPEPDEIATCSPWLVEQIRTMKPKVIVTLGRFSFNFLVPDVKISEARGNTYRIKDVSGLPLDENPAVGEKPLKMDDIRAKREDRSEPYADGTVSENRRGKREDRHLRRPYEPLVLACYHPAVALYDPRKKQTIVDDLAKLPKLVECWEDAA